MRRKRRAWLAVGQLLHAGEHARRFPTAAVMFAALRGTDLTAHPDGVSVLAAAAQSGVATDAVGRLRVRSFASQVETGLHERDLTGAVSLLTTRPGELLRRLDHLLRIGTASDQQQVMAALPAAALAVSPAVLLTTPAQLRTRTQPAPRRLVFPKAGAAAAHLLPDSRPALPGRCAPRSSRSSPPKCCGAPARSARSSWP